ncbi:MAG: hypothetical protein MUE51_11935 [Thermoleophilia bacterium]|jgi:hypothetical protein|nr:hypothetical protein [Thermoleophilia bacterium]
MELSRPARPRLPSRAELERRARWFASLSEAELARLPELTLREIEGMYRAWRGLDPVPSVSPRS